MTWKLIESQTLTSSVASVTLGSGGTIPQTFKELRLAISSRASSTNATFLLYPNGSSANLSDQLMFANGSTITCSNNTNILCVGSCVGGDTATAFGNAEYTFPNYTSSANKHVIAEGATENNGSQAYQSLTGGLWSNSAAITSLQILIGAGNLEPGSTFTLYGLY